MAHDKILPECSQIFNNINEKLDTSISDAKDFYDKWDKHLIGSVKQRAEHETRLNLLTWLFGIVTVPVIFMMFKTFSK